MAASQPKECSVVPESDRVNCWVKGDGLQEIRMSNQY